MKFTPLTKPNTNIEEIEQDYKLAHKIGSAALGNKCFFFKKKLKTFYVSYDDLKQAFRRIYAVPAKMCCANGDIELEHIVIITKSGIENEIPLPDKKAAEHLFAEMKEKAPSLDYSSPKKD